MGLRFRKSIKVAPGVKLNLNKNSTSVTIGTRGAHYTVNSNGKKTASASIPGTGVSYVSTTGGGKKKETKTNKKNTSKTTPTTKTTPSKGSSTKIGNKNSKESVKAQPKKKGGCLGSILLVFAILCLIFAIVPSDDKKEDSKEANQQKMVEEQSEENTISQSDDDEAEPNIDKTTESLSEDNIDPEPIAATQPENAVKMVWLPESGTKYHSNSSCSNMNNPRQVTLDEAVNAGYEPCKKCY